MAQHEFGIMKTTPEEGVRYDRYPLEADDRVPVDDDDILPFMKQFQSIRCYWHTLDRAELGLAYHGVTLIPPESHGAVMELIWRNPHLSELLALFAEAERTKKYVIHFGI